MRVIWQPGQWSCICYIQTHLVGLNKGLPVFSHSSTRCKIILLRTMQPGSSYFKGRKYDGCTRAHSVNGKPWCAIQVLSSLISLLIKFSHHHDHHDVNANWQLYGLCRYQLLRLHCAGPTVSQGIKPICLFDQCYDDINDAASSSTKTIYFITWTYQSKRSNSHMTTQMPTCEWRLSSWLLHQPLWIFAATNKQKGDKTMLVVSIAKCFRATLATAMTPAISMETAVQDNR